MSPAEMIVNHKKQSQQKYGDLALIVLSSLKNCEEQLNDEINLLLGLPKNTSHTVSANQVRFQNGEGKVVLGESVRAKDVYILCDVGNYNCKYKIFGEESRYSPDDHFADLKRTICAISGRAQRITVVMPLLYASRQHRRKARESLDCALALRELEALGVNCIITFDAHDANVQNSVPLLSFENIFPTYPILREFIKAEKISYEPGNLIVVAPDAGAMERAVYHANVLKQDVGMFYKRRDYTKVVGGKNPILDHNYLGADVAGKSIVIVDDMIASGESVLDIVKQLKKQGALNIYAICSFAFFTEGTAKFDNCFEEGLLKAVYTTNLSYIPEAYCKKPWLKIVDLVPYMAQVVATVNASASLSYISNQTGEISQLIEKLGKKIN